MGNDANVKLRRRFFNIHYSDRALVVLGRVSNIHSQLLMDRAKQCQAIAEPRRLLDTQNRPS